MSLSPKKEFGYQPYTTCRVNVVPNVVKNTIYLLGEFLSYS